MATAGEYDKSYWYNIIIQSHLKLLRKSRDVTISVSYTISALISYNFIIKNYVYRKIVFLSFDIYKIIMTSC
jgi:hypothetical protein